MGSKPTLALCTPAFNAEALLLRLLDSAKKQTIPFDEIWVYDDASRDHTAEVAAQWGARVVKAEVNRGCSFGKNALAEKTSCEWVHFHDADDALAPDFVENARRWMERPEAPDVVLFGCEFREANSETLIIKTQYDDSALRQDPVRYCIAEMITSTCGLYRRDAFLRAGGYDVDPLVLYNEDSAMHCQLSRAGLRFAADPAIVAVGYQSAHSMSVDHQAQCFQAQYQVMKKSALAGGKTYGKEIARRLWEIANASAAQLDWVNVDACVALAIALDGCHPPYPNALFRWGCQCFPRMALRAREWVIRLWKPHLRRPG
jgi:glycosyltransferase involved in cell wall biosynthesis